MIDIRRICAAAMSALALAAAAPAAAQEPADQNLRCAAWALAGSGQAEDPGQRRALSMVMAYFLGRYEQAGGNGMEAALTPETLGATIGDIGQANALCQPLAQAFGAQLNAVGTKLQAGAKAQQEQAGR